MSKEYRTYEQTLDRIVNKDGVDCVLCTVGKETTPLLTKIKRFFRPKKRTFFMLDTTELLRVIDKGVVDVEDELL